MLRAYKVQQTEAKRALGLELQDSDLVFSHADGTAIRPDTVTRAFKHYAEGVGLPTGRLHDLRHTHATLLLRQGVHPKIVKRTVSEQWRSDHPGHLQPCTTGIARGSSQKV